MKSCMAAILCLATVVRAAPPCVSGVYPHLAYFNEEGECGTGAVVPWADRLWVVTYAPHGPKGSSDKLYEITPDLRQIVRPESIGGTPANRMIHSESQQLFIGPYAIDAQRNVRPIPYAEMFGRHTGNARHLTDPAGKICYATMEEGMYEVDVKTLAVTRLWSDEQVKDGRHADLPGYHGKGFYSGQGRYIYSNNGEHGSRALTNPSIPSGCLAEWDGKSDAWRVVRRNQFTEVTGPGGILGNSNPASDPVWSLGWDHRSLILMVLDGGQWHAYRLPKSSHSYDGAHGWNTEWPRIRDIGEPDLLMTMHGMFWRFPRTFSSARSAGIAPRSSYLKVVGDFCRWNDRVVLGCDDTAKSEFLNKRRAKGSLAGPGQSNSNLWFVEPARLDRLGPPLGRGAVWFDEPVKAGAESEPFLFSGFERRGLHLRLDVPATVTLEVDREGDGRWQKLRDVSVDGYAWVSFAKDEAGAWIRLRLSRDCGRATACFQYSSPDARGDAQALAKAGGPPSLLLVRGGNKRTLGVAAGDGFYELDAGLNLRRVEDPSAEAYTRKGAAIPRGVLQADAASSLYVDDAGRRWRLPRGAIGEGRVSREVATERDLFSCASTFYELPAENAGGFARVRPIATHNLPVHDYCSYRGLLVMSGVTGEGEHAVRSADGKVALWVGVVDDLWQLGKPRGAGGPWSRTAVKAGVASDPYLMSGYDRKTLTLSHGADAPVAMRVEVDLTGTGVWAPYRTFDVPAGTGLRHEFPEGFSAYWCRVVAEKDCTATAELVYQ